MRLKEVVYTVSPFEVTVMSGLFKDMPKKFAEKVKHVSLLRSAPSVSVLLYHKMGSIMNPLGLQTS